MEAVVSFLYDTLSPSNSLSVSSFPLKSKNYRRFSLRAFFVVLTIVAIVFGRWHTTSSRRAAFDRLSSQPCGFLPGFNGVFHNPNDFLSVRGDSWFTDLISPPRLVAIEIREPVTPDQRDSILRDTLVFNELTLVVLSPGATESDAAVWRSHLPESVRIER